MWDPATSSFEPFGGLKTVAKAKEGNRSFTPLPPFSFLSSHSSSRNTIASTVNDCGEGDGFITCFFLYFSSCPSFPPFLFLL